MYALLLVAGCTPADLPSDPLAAVAARHADWGTRPEDLQLRRREVDELGQEHALYQHVAAGLPVFGSELRVHLDPAGELLAVTDGLARELQPEPPVLDADAAVEIAVEAAGGWAGLADRPEAELGRLRTGRPAWRVALRTPRGRPLLFVDAVDGRIRRAWDDRRAGSGSARYDGEVEVASSKKGSRYYLEDGGRGVGTYSYGNGTGALAYVTDGDDRWTSDPTAVQAHHAAAASLDFYAALGRDGLDGAGGPGAVASVSGSGTVIALGVHYGSGEANAWWDGGEAVFGDGDGSSFDPLVSIDVVGHELSHGVNASTAAFEYVGESGALDESFADVFGAMIERSVEGDGEEVWQMAEDCATPTIAGDALRYLADPAADGSSVDHYEDLREDTDVHHGSGVGNLAFHLLAEGGAHPRRGGEAVEGIGADAATAIWYRALAWYLGSASDYDAAREATLSAAADLHGSGSAEYSAVEEAWAAVGVGSPTTRCEGWDEARSGSLGATGDAAYEPDGASFVTTTSGTHEAWLSGPEDANFDLLLQRYSSGRWTNLKYGKSSGSEETVSRTGLAAGSYRWRVSSVSGSGAYTLCYDHP